MNQEEVVRDVTSVTSRLQLHQELKAEIDAREDTFQTVAENGRLMIEAGHFAASDVRISYCYYVTTDAITYASFQNSSLYKD